MEVFFWILILFTLIYEPIVGYFGFQRFKERLALNPHARIHYYINIMIGLWVPTIFIIFIIVMTDLTLKNIGITLPSINTETLGPILTYIVFILAAIYFLLMLYYIFSYHSNEGFRKKFIESKNRQLNDTSFAAALLPISKKEKKVWTYVSFTAGVTEEIIYRGFLIFAIAYLFPSFNLEIAMLCASVLFGLAHTYQGFGNVIRTTLFGYFFSILYIGLGSILPIIVLHFLIDYVAKLGDEIE